jgi:hypothetical protein
MFSFDLPRMMESTTDAVQTYAQLCGDYFGKRSESREALTAESSRSGADDDASYGVNEVLFGLMSENDKLGELSRLLGKLQFAQQGKDRNMVAEVIEEITALSRHLPTEFQVSDLLAAAQEATGRGSQLAQLYLDRCFRMSAGDANRVRELDQQIATLQRQG